MLALAFLSSGVFATEIQVLSVGYDCVEVLVNGSATRRLRIGEVTPEGVTLVSVVDGAATMEVDGFTSVYRIGQRTGAGVVAIKRAGNGHFMAPARINGIAVPAMIDIGATMVAIGTSVATTLHIDYAAGRRQPFNTSNGQVMNWLVDLDQVEVGGVRLRHVQGVVSENLNVVLIGMSFLKQVDMVNRGDVLLLRQH